MTPDYHHLQAFDIPGPLTDQLLGSFQYVPSLKNDVLIGRGKESECAHRMA